MKRKIALTLVALVCFMMLAGCGNNASSNSQNKIALEVQRTHYQQIQTAIKDLKKQLSHPESLKVSEIIIDQWAPEFSSIHIKFDAQNEYGNNVTMTSVYVADGTVEDTNYDIYLTIIQGRNERYPCKIADGFYAATENLTDDYCCTVNLEDYVSQGYTLI